MKESRVFELNQVTAEQVLEAVTTFLRGEKGMEVQSVATPNGYLIQAAQADTLRTLSGMKLATTVELTVNGTQLNVTLGEGQWADKLGAGAIGAFDINNACTGFVSATDIADCYIKSGKARTVLVVSAETLSRIVDYTDRGTCILFGDGAAAAVYRATEDDNLGIQSTFIAADGSGAEYLRMEALPVEDPFAEDRTVDPKARFLKMQGAAVVRFTARAVPQAIDTALQRAGITADDIDWVVPHQANLRILDVIARRYHLPKEKVYVNMNRFGNTSSASVPICLNEMRRNGLLREGQTIVCTGFGGGLTYGAFVLKL